MAKAKNPETFAESFGVDEGKLEALSVLNPTLAIDTKLFVDPLLLAASSVPEISGDASQLYRRHFETVISLLAASKSPEDVAWRNARRHLQFHEIPGTCLGYGAATIAGSGFGAALTERMLTVGKEIVDLGVRDPDLFPALALFESDIGPDRVSDMTTNVVFEALAKMNARLLEELGIADQAEDFDIAGTSGRFVVNPLHPRRTPVVLVPNDVLRKLPIANDWDSVADCASSNAALRSRVNQHISEIWKAKTKRDKSRLKAEVLADAAAFETLLDALHGVPLRAYAVDADPDGIIAWAAAARRITAANPLSLQDAPSDPKEASTYIRSVVKSIVDQFRFLVEERGLWKELYDSDGKPRHEGSAQRLFFAVAYNYCKANNIDVSPEVDTGSGAVDFKFSRAFDDRVLVEAKLSKNSKLVDGYTKQLETYKNSEETSSAFYLVVDVGRMGKKDEKLFAAKNEATKRGDPVSEIEMVDGTTKRSASKK